MNLRLLLSIAILALACGTAPASTADAENRLHEAVDKVIAIADHTSSNGALMVNLRPVLEKYLSFAAMTRRAIGPGWRQFTPDQQKKATDLFTTLVIRTYSSKFTLGEHPVVTFKAASAPAPGRIEIPTTLLYQGSRYDVTYRMEETEGLRITDVVIEGVSLIANYRSQFDAQFQRGGPNAVINSLSEAVAHPR